MMFVTWGLLFCVVILTSHISSNEAKDLGKKMEDARYEQSEFVSTFARGMSISDKTYISIGRRRVIVGIASVMTLLAMYLVKPMYGFYPNSILYILNGLIISSMIGYTVEGLIMWNTSITDLSEDEEGEEIEA